MGKMCIRDRRYTEEGRIYGATFIDHRTGCVLNGSRMGKELSANALQEHFTQPYAGQPSIPLSVMVEGQEDKQGYSGGEYENHSGGMNLFAPEGPAVDAEEEAFIRAMPVSYTHLDVYKRQSQSRCRS